MAFPTRKIGLEGTQVPSVSVGLMSLGHAYGHAGDDAERLKFLDALYEMGETHWDDADIYGDTEDLVGQWFTSNPDKRKNVFLATKGAFQSDRSVRSDPEYVRQACEKSLKRLKTSYIDLYYMHRVDSKTPIEKTMQALAELKK